MIQSMFSSAASSATLTYGPEELRALMATPVDPNLEHWEAIAYSNQAEEYYLAIWQSAEDEEFVISSNSFGLYEGMKEPLGALHKFYVMAPTVVLVLCSVLLRDQPQMIDGHVMRMRPDEEHLALSMMMDVHHSDAKVVQKGATRDDDVMRFDVQRLTKEQTHTVNAIILAHVRGEEKGMVSWRGDRAMLRTAEAFQRNGCFEEPQFDKRRYGPLMRELREKLGEEEPTEATRDKWRREEEWEQVAIGMSITQPRYGKIWETNMEIYDMLRAEEAGDRFAEYRAKEREVLNGVAKLFNRQGVKVDGKELRRPARLVRKMADKLAVDLFTQHLTTLLVMTGVELNSRGLFVEQYLLAIAGWLVENNRGYLKVTLGLRTPFVGWYYNIWEYTDVGRLCSALAGVGDVLIEKQITDPEYIARVTGTAMGKCGQPNVENLFTSYERSRYPPHGTFLKTHLALYDALYEHAPTIAYFQPYERLAIIAVVRTLHQLDVPARRIGPYQNANLHPEVDDTKVVMLFGYAQYLLEQGGVSLKEEPVFREQVVVGVLKWLLANWREAFVELEKSVAPERLMKAGTPGWDREMALMRICRLAGWGYVFPI